MANVCTQASCGFCGRCTDRQGDERSKAGYRCLVKGCSWPGGLALAAYAHHREHHHPIQMVNGIRAQFSCCPETDARTEAKTA